MSDERRGPILIDLEEETSVPPPDPARAAVVPDADVPQGAAMQRAAVLASRQPSRLATIFWGAVTGLVGVVITTALWDFALNLLQRNAVLGLIVVGLTAAALLAALIFAIREAAAWFRLGRLDRLHKAGSAAAAAHDLPAARAVVDRLLSFYAGRPDLADGIRRVEARRGDAFDADTLLGLAEAELLQPIDRVARAEIEAAARQVATVTAIVPLALADVVAALTANLRMIRRIAEAYGGRAGTVGSWRLTRAVLTHLVATGAVAVGDDLIHSVAGGGLVSRVSRRFGEGVVNGALTARVGVAAMEVCRPLPFVAVQRPSVTGLVKRALAGLFGTSGSTERSTS